MSDDRILVVDELVAGYVPEVNILNGCNIEVRAGEFVGVIGPNGAGKSTVLKRFLVSVEYAAAMSAFWAMTSLA